MGVAPPKLGGVGPGVHPGGTTLALPPSLLWEGRATPGERLRFAMPRPSGFLQQILQRIVVIENVSGDITTAKPFILVAEDNRDSRDSLKALLEAYGFDVVVAENGEEAVNRALVSEPDLVLMDVMMPRVDGIEATKRLRGSSDFRQVPILALSAMVGSRELALNAGCDDYLTKPIEIPALVASIRGWLARGHTPRRRSTAEQRSIRR